MKVKSYPMKRIFVIIALFVLPITAAKAQDIIVTQDGKTIEAYRTDIGKNAVYYQLENNNEASIKSISKSDVLVIKMQDGTKIIMDELEPKIIASNEVVQNMYIPRFPVEPVADPETIANAEIGSMIEFYDGTKGIVFYLDGNGHGLAVYLYETKNLVNWQDASSWRDCVDIEIIPNERKTELQMGLGSFYCDEAIKQVGLEELPAIKWCRSIGPNWYLPSLGELYQLFVVANLSKAGFGPISKAIKQAGGNSMRAQIYYSSSEDDNTNVFALHLNDGVVIAKKYVGHSCRAVRMF